MEGAGAAVMQGMIRPSGWTGRRCRASEGCCARAKNGFWMIDGARFVRLLEFGDEHGTCRGRIALATQHLAEAGGGTGGLRPRRVGSRAFAAGREHQDGQP